MEVRYSKRAVLNAKEIYGMLLKKFSEREADRFHVMLSDFEKAIIKFPHLYPASNTRPSIRQAVLHKRLTLYYTTKENMIFIVSMKDNRQEQPKDYS